MKASFIPATFKDLSSRHSINPRALPLLDTPPPPLDDRQLKARALQRWENEGGRILPKPPAAGSVPPPTNANPTFIRR